MEVYLCDPIRLCDKYFEDFMCFYFTVAPRTSTESKYVFSYILLTAHLDITSGRWPTWCTILLYNTFISILYMFGANTCSSSGGHLY